MITSRPKPRCFCERHAEPGACPDCTRVDWSKVKPANGDHALEKSVASRFASRVRE